jgi:hypothetical protein
MAKVKRSERLTKMVEGSSRAAEAAAAKAGEILGRAEGIEKRADESVEKVTKAAEAAEKACGEATEAVRRAVEAVPQDAAKAEAEKIGAAVEAARKAIHEAGLEAMKPVHDAGAALAKVKDDALTSVSAALGAVQTAGEEMKVVIGELRSLLEPLRKAVQDCRAAKGLADDAARRLSEANGTGPATAREEVADAAPVSAPQAEPDPLVVGPGTTG